MGNTKKSLKLVIAFLLLCMIVSISACNINNSTNGGFTISVNLNGGEGVDAREFISSNNLVKPDKDPTKKGCEFLGWYYDNDYQKPIVFDIRINENITIHARWSDIRWIVSFVYGGDIETQYAKVADKGKATLPTELPQRNGYAIVGWFKNTNYATKFSFSESIQDDISIYAKWDIDNYIINYHFDNGLPHIDTNYSYTINDTVTLAIPFREKYDFLGWYDNVEFSGDPITTIVKGSYGNKEFFAKYLCDKNDIEKTMLGAIITADTITINVSYLCDSLLLDNTNITVSDRATFVLVDLGNEPYSNNAIPFGEQATDGYLEKTAKVIVTSEKGTAKEYSLIVRKYAEGASVTVTFHTGIAPTIGTEEIPISTVVAEPLLSEVEGYTFDGWFNESDFVSQFDFDELIGMSKDLYAKHTPIEYSISYNLGISNNSLENPEVYTIESDITFASGENTTLYNFAGWYQDNNFTNEILGINDSIGDVTLYAKYVLAQDNSAMNSSFSGSQTFNAEQKSELTRYLEYSVYEKSSTASFNLTVPSDDIDSFIQTAWKNIVMPKNSISWNASHIDGAVSMEFTYNNYPNAKASEDDKYTQLSYLVHEEYTPVRAVDYDDFKINSIDNKVEVSSSEMLYYALAIGYRPVPVELSSAERIYNKAKLVLCGIVDDSMSDAEKLHKIYDWLILNVVYDKVLYDMTIAGTTTDIHCYNGFYLEGVFDDLRAVCDGISKALVVLARIEGIEAYQVIYSPENASVGHAWNKVNVEGKYYIIDATSGGTIIDNNEVLTHKYFMLSASQFKNITSKGTVGEENYFAGYEETILSDKVADTIFDTYSNIVIPYEGESFDMVIESQQELNTLLLIFKQMDENNPETNFTIDVFIAFDYGESISDELQVAINASNCSQISSSFDKGYLVLIMIRTV